MSTPDSSDRLFVFISFFIQIALIIFFAARKWQFDIAIQFGWIVYAFAVVTTAISLVLLFRGKSWYFWLPGFLYAAWAIFGYIVDIARPVEWRSPIYLPVFIPYLVLYFSSLMFYWWPLARIQRQYWFIYAVLYVISTVLNVSSHGW